MLTDAQIITEWKRRRDATWRAIRLALVVLVVTGAGFWYLSETPMSEMTGTRLLLSLLNFCILGAAALVLIFRMNKLYRCPKCNEVPGYDGWPVNPRRCERCNAVLRNSVAARHVR
jgi:hypothetical protein